MKLPKGHLAVVAGCNGDIWEAPKGRSSEVFPVATSERRLWQVAIQAGRLREKIKDKPWNSSSLPLINIPCYHIVVEPHKVVAEVSKIENYRRGELL